MAKFDVEYVSSVDTSTVAILDSLTDSSVTWTELHEAIKIIKIVSIEIDLVKCILNSLFSI
tara:strand:+ start:901 stop:1083 length:183 start_codon:yes stop_codon:yes gene_type:complete